LLAIIAQAPQPLNARTRFALRNLQA